MALYHLDQMKTGSFRQLFHPDQLINGYEDAANNFARGFHTVGRILKRVCENRIRKEFEISDFIHGIHIYRSLGGGTGSGLTATLFETLLQYPKAAKIEIPIHPSPHLACAIVEPYNCILSEHFCMEDIDVGLLIDNESLYDIMNTHLDIKDPILHQINKLVAQVCSSLTASSRFENELYNDFSILTNLVPYPRIHFPLVSYAPFASEAKMSHNTNTVLQITHDVFDATNQLVKCDPISGKYMSCSLVYRGAISPTQVFSALSEIKSCRSVRFVDWCPTGFKVGIVKQPPQVLPESNIGNSTKNVVMMTNSSSVSVLWHRLAQKFHKLYSKRSFVHWFVAEGIEENEFCESLYNIATLAKDYEEVALDTKVEDKKEFSASADKEGITTTSGTKQNGEESSRTGQKKDNGKDDNVDTEADAGDDDDDEDNENASNTIKTIYSLLNLNSNKVGNWRGQFENLLGVLHQNYAHSQRRSSKSRTESCPNRKCDLSNNHCSEKDLEMAQISQNTIPPKAPLMEELGQVVNGHDRDKTDRWSYEDLQLDTPRSGENYRGDFMLCRSTGGSLDTIKNGTECLTDEEPTFSLMESLIRLTST